ncbi:aminotransferase class V-fold PLP-dependent enzyme [bacterium]|nr:aminotransferase class V-fold PLP-dependent enzyme [bacterium]
MRIGRTLPPTAAPIDFSDILAGLKHDASGVNHIKSLKEDIRLHFGVKHCFLVSSGRAALTMILLAMKNLQNKTKNEVVLPAYTSFSVPSAVVRAGLKVSLCDIDPETMGIDIESLKKALSDKTLCIVICHLFGYPCNLEAILKVAREKKIFVIDDAAQSMGATFKGKPLGTFGDAGLFSLSRGKNITTVDGGIIITNSDDIAEQISKIRLKHVNILDRLGIIFRAMTMSVLLRPIFYWIPQGLPFLRLGASIFSTKFDLKEFTEFQAKIGQRMFKKLDKINDIRKKIAKKLIAALSGCDNIKFPKEIECAESVFLRLPLICDVKCECGQPSLGVVRSYPHPLNEIIKLRPHLVNYNKSFPKAKLFSDQLWTLPTHKFVEQKDIENILSHFSKKFRPAQLIPQNPLQEEGWTRSGRGV